MTIFGSTNDREGKVDHHYLRGVVEYKKYNVLYSIFQPACSGLHLIANKSVLLADLTLLKRSTSRLEPQFSVECLEREISHTIFFK